MNMHYIWVPYFVNVVSLVFNKQNNGYDRKKELNMFKFWSGFKAKRWRSGFLQVDQPPEL